MGAVRYCKQMYFGTSIQETPFGWPLKCKGRTHLKTAWAERTRSYQIDDEQNKTLHYNWDPSFELLVAPSSCRIDRAHVLANYGSKITLLSSEQEVSLSETVLDHSKILKNIRRCIRNVMGQTWKKDDKVLVHTVPKGLPRSGDRLKAGEHLQRKELNKCGKKIAEKLKLMTPEGISRIHGSCRNGDSEIEECVRKCLAEVATSEGAFYREAQDYNWKQRNLAEDDRKNGHLHERYQTSNLTEKELELLRKYPILWALRCDIENDSKLVEYMERDANIIEKGEK